MRNGLGKKITVKGLVGPAETLAVVSHRNEIEIGAHFEKLFAFPYELGLRMRRVDEDEYRWPIEDSIRFKTFRLIQNTLLGIQNGGTVNLQRSQAETGVPVQCEGNHGFPTLTG
jgi:hypothetical protein